MTGRNSMLTLNMCDFCSHERSDCGAQPALADLLNLENLDSEQKGPVDILKERFYDPNL